MRKNCIWQNEVLELLDEMCLEIKNLSLCNASGTILGSLDEFDDVHVGSMLYYYEDYTLGNLKISTTKERKVCAGTVIAPLQMIAIA